MKRYWEILACILLLFNGSGAIYGGLSLIVHPDGSGIGLPLELLRSTGFASYLVPGIILLVCNGLFSLITLILQFGNSPLKGWAVFAQGAILLGWIGVQVAMIGLFFFLQYVLGATAILLMWAGLGIKMAGKKR